MKRLLLLLLLFLALGIGGYQIWQNTINSGADEVSFNEDIKPILNKHCTTCHGGVKKLGDLSLLFEEEAKKAGKSGNPAILPGDAMHSELYKRVSATDEFERMPPEGDGLTNSEISLIRDWIDQGAKWEKHWAYTTIERAPKVPTSGRKWSEHPIDQFIHQTLSEKGLSPNDKANPNQLTRRLALDLIGLPPNQQQVAHLAKYPEHYEAYVDSLLDAPQFGERWASMWLDLARYADSKGYEKDGHREIWQYRDWVIRAFNEDKPFNDFTIEQIAGDLLPNVTPDQYIATAFHRNTMTNTEGGTDNEEFRVAAIIDRVNTTWEAWMSTSISCAQCHNHPYDPFTQENFYENYAFFNNSGDQDLNGEFPVFKSFDTLEQAAIHRIQQWIKTNVAPTEVEPTTNYYNDLIHFSEPKLTMNHCEEQHNTSMGIETIVPYHEGYVYFQPFDLTGLDQVMINFTGVTPGRFTISLDGLDGPKLGSWNIPQKRGLHFFEIEQVSGKHRIYLQFHYNNKAYRAVSSSIYWLHFYKGLPGKRKPGYAQVNDQLQAILTSQPKVVTPVMLENPKVLRRTTHLFERGNWMVHGKAVAATPPPALPPALEATQLNRLDLAKWMVDSRNPLTARVFVNRIWEQLFGRGLVLTTEDLGTQGEWPTHPELLDWLAYQFMHEYDWKIKPLIKAIVLSHTYQQSSKLTAEKQEKDPDNRWLSRGSRFRLSAEQVRDQALTLSGLLSTKQFGPSVMPPQPDGIWQVIYSNEKWKTSTGEDRYRRGVYTYWKRTSPYPSMVTFDSPSREFCVSRRVRTNTPLQALVTLNDPVYLEAAYALAHQMLEITQQESLESALDNIYQQLLFEPINPTTTKKLLALYQRTLSYYEQAPQKASALWDNHPQLEHLKPTRQEELISFAALSAVTNALLNLDELLTKS